MVCKYLYSLIEHWMLTASKSSTSSQRKRLHEAAASSAARALVGYYWLDLSSTKCIMLAYPPWCIKLLVKTIIGPIKRWQTISEISGKKHVLIFRVQFILAERSQTFLHLSFRCCKHIMSKRSSGMIVLSPWAAWRIDHIQKNASSFIGPG